MLVHYNYQGKQDYYAEIINIFLIDSIHFCLFKQIIHKTVVDTSVAFPHRLGPPNKLSLRRLAADILQKIIQDNGKYNFFLNIKWEFYLLINFVTIKIKS